MRYIKCRLKNKNKTIYEWLPSTCCGLYVTIGMLVHHHTGVSYTIEKIIKTVPKEKLPKTAHNSLKYKCLIEGD